MNRLADHLSVLISLYGETAGRQVYDQLARLVEYSRPHIPPPRRAGVDQGDAILITYGDQVSEPGIPPLRSLADFCSRWLSGMVSGIHILPFYPYSSDDGFSVIDYTAVDPALGGWTDIAGLRQGFRLMFDAVVNHMSARSPWFEGFLNGDPRYRDYFIDVPAGADLSRVVRPRTLPLLTSFTVAGQPCNIWTTFSADQVDLNFKNPAVLLDVLAVLLFYVSQGAEFIRLDAIAFLWKEYGTPCLHLPQTHRIIQLMRAVLDEVAPHVALITETNVPHRDNLSYLGDGYHEAQMVYNFALPPLTLHAFRTGDARVLSRWAAELSLPSDRVTFFNFLASHDGIGLNPARGILSEAEIGALVNDVRAHGGRVSYKNNPDGTTSPYELNINYFDALSLPVGYEPLELQVDRFLASQAIMLALVGVPGIYFHSLFGSRGWPAGVEQTGHNRTINRQKLERARVEHELVDPSSLRARVFHRYARLLRARAARPAFDPHGRMEILDAGPAVFAVLRSAPGAIPVLCLHNVSSQSQPLPPSLTSRLSCSWDELLDLVTGHPPTAASLAPYQSLWLSARP